ncbi:hypothetical protein QZH41_011136 [Actinostola sp. cb2023]|nr:hypothetical protein QZH41_011136 [Actinostola sp. cb2023]
MEFIPPYPPNKILIEGQPLTISCSAADSSDYPRNVTFKRRGADGFTFEEIKTSERVYITNSTRNDTEKGFVRTAVLHITGVLPEDDNSKAPWQCWAYSASAHSSQGCTIYVVPKSDLPKATIHGGGTISYGGSANLTCNVTNGKLLSAPLSKLAWTKDMEIVQNGTTSTNLEPLIITKATTRDAGEYRCTALVNLKTFRLVSMTLGTAILHIQLKMVNGTTQVQGAVSSNVVMECPAEGYPLNVTWFRVNEDGQENNITMSQRYVVTRPCSSCRYRLTIYEFQSRDQGRYVCKATRNTESGQHQFEVSITEGKS